VRDRTLSYSTAASFLIHLALILLASASMSRPISSPSDVIAINLIEVSSIAEEKKESAPSPKTKTVTPPKLIHKPDFIETQRLASTTPRVESNEQKPADKPQMTSFSLPAPGPEKGAGNNGKPAGEAEGGEAGAGDLFAEGDMAMIPGASTVGGGGGQGVAGWGKGKRGDGSGGEIGEGPGQGLAFARPLGGYQVKPRYPDSARQERAQGVTLLKVRVLENGRVGQILVEQSAGHPDLDESATEAVKKWRFEPARRGHEPVAVWVLLPVKFELR